MKYTLDIVIEMPLDECMKTFANSENMKHWQRGLTTIEHISGTPGEFCAKMKMHYTLRKRPISVIETITHKNLPHEWYATYTTDGADNIQENFFKATSENQTQWTSINEFFPLNFRMHLKLWVMPRTFKKQTLRYMKDFKNFVENGISVADA
ncbi:SRPBCC family protein [Gelidibacter algens]|nr:SRPBCC family protein [Gelidibacter algens]OBX25372.1 hypothetical protein A9996_10365 [Gelidibacter algens]